LISNQEFFFIEVAIVFVFFTPFTYFFVAFYFIFLAFIFTVSNFIIFWVFIEFIILIFIGLSYTLFSNNFSSLILYFLIQTLSSFLILVFYLYPFPYIFTFSIFIKLSIFPFHFWFLNVCYRFPNFVLFLSSSFHKIPLFLILILFTPSLSLAVVFISLAFTLLISGFMILRSSDFRSIIVSSSVGNNSWFLLSSIVDLFTFCFFFFFYFITLYFLFSQLSLFRKPSVYSYSSAPLIVPISVSLLRGIPPFPMFFSKMFVLVSSFRVINYPSYLFIFILCSCFMLVGYLYSCFKYLIHSYGSQSFFILN